MAPPDTYSKAYRALRWSWTLCNISWMHI